MTFATLWLGSRVEVLAGGAGEIVGVTTDRERFLVELDGGDRIPELLERDQVRAVGDSQARTA